MSPPTTPVAMLGVIAREQMALAELSAPLDADVETYDEDPRIWARRMRNLISISQGVPLAVTQQAIILLTRVEEVPWNPAWFLRADPLTVLTQVRLSTMFKVAAIRQAQPIELLSQQGFHEAVWWRASEVVHYASLYLDTLEQHAGLALGNNVEVEELAHA